MTDAQAISQALAVELAKLRERLALTEQSANTANEQHLVEYERIRTELAEQKKAVQSLVAEHDQGRAELATEKAQSAAAQETHRVAERLTKIEADRDYAHKQAATAREEADHLRGQLDAKKLKPPNSYRRLAVISMRKSLEQRKIRKLQKVISMDASALTIR